MIHHARHNFARVVWVLCLRSMAGPMYGTGAGPCRLDVVGQNMPVSVACHQGGVGVCVVTRRQGALVNLLQRSLPQVDDANNDAPCPACSMGDVQQHVGWQLLQPVGAACQQGEVGLNYIGYFCYC